MLADSGITLLFQPPCSPDFNTCEFCFRQIKDCLRRYQLLAEHETKIVIAEAILQIYIPGKLVLVFSPLWLCFLVLIAYISFHVVTSNLP